MPPRKSTRIVGKTSADASVSAKLGPKKRKLKSSKKPIVFYFAYGDTRLDLAKGYYPLYLGRDPLLQPVVYELAEEADATLHIESDDQTPADLVSAVPNVFSELPTELLVEILLLLGPRDLLYLTRATKYLRKLLSSDSDNVANIWKETFFNVPIQTRPPPFRTGSSPLHYASFLYDIHCSFCNSPPEFHTKFPPAKRSPYFYPSKYFDEINVKKLDIRIVKLCYTAGRFQNYETNQIVLNGEYLMYRQEYIGHMDNRARLYQFVQQREHEARAESNLLGRTSEFRTLMRIERQTILPRRLAAIREKLSQEGYSRIANHAPHTFWKTPPVFINREWRDYEWPPIRTKCILSSYHLYVADRKRDFPLAFARYLNNLEAFINSFALPEIRPPTIYFASLEPFASIIKETEGFRVLIDTDFRKRIQDLQSIVNKWRETTDEYLLGLVRESLDESAEESADQGLLSCAGVFFKCGFCNEPVSYPRILVHKCLRSKVVDNSAPATSLDCDNGVKLVDFEAGEDRPPKLKAVSMVTEWEDLTKPYRMGAHAGNEAIFFDTNASRIARKIILATGDDPLKITQEEMSAKNIRLECLQCGQGIPKRKRTLASGTRATYRTALCMNWTRAILHELENHANEGTTNRWRQVDSRKDLDSIHNEEAKATKVKNSVINLDTSLQDAPQIVQISTRSNRR